MLRFHLLGPLEAWRGDQQILQSDWRTRQTLAVLKLLLDQHDRLVSFERLGDLVWPDSDADAARTSLRGAVRTIRRVLEPELPAGGASRYLHTEPQGYRFVSSGCSIDVDGFIQAREAGMAAERRRDREAALRAFREGVAHYRGDYLADDPLADWAVDRRERLRSAYLDVLERLARLQTEIGAYSDAIESLERALTADPLREELYCQLMRCHAAAGRRSHALAAYERGRKLLETELGAEPGAETRRLRDQLARTPAQDAAVASPPAAPELEVAFVGREGELAAIGRAWGRAGAEAGHLVLVRGAAGAGKTRLAQQFTEQGAPQVRALWLTAHEAEHDLPFAPLITVLANWLARSATAAQVQRLGPYAPALAHLLPQVRAVWPGCPLLAGGGPESSQLLEALTQALLLLKGQGPSLLVFDDLHWADPKTLVWLGYALRRFEPGILVLATSRDGEPAPDHHLSFLAGVRRGQRFTELELSPLSIADVLRLLGEIQPASGEARPFAQRLHEATRGNPLFLVETLRELQRRGSLYHSYVSPSAGRRAGAGSEARQVEELPLPASVRDAILARVRRLEATAHEALTAICVLGVPCRASLVARVLDRPQEGTLAALEILLERELLQPTGDGQGYTVQHPLVRRVVYDHLSPGRRQEWHSRTARALQQEHPDHPEVVAQQVLRHLLQGDANPDEVIRVGEVAGTHALSQQAYSEALFCYQAVLDRLRGTNRQADLIRITQRRGEALTGAGLWDEAVACYEQILPHVLEPLARCRVRRNLGMALADRGARGLDRALDVLDAAEGELLSLDPADPNLVIERGMLASTRAVAHFHRSDFRALATCAQRALELLDGRPGMELEVAWQFNRIAMAEQRLGRLDAAEASFRRAVARAQAMGESVAEAGFKDNLAVLLLHRGQLAGARLLLEEALQTVRERGVLKLEAGLLGDRGYLLDYLGDLRGSRVAYQAALEKAELLDARYTLVMYSVGLGDVLLRLGEYVRARAVLEGAVDRGREIGTRQRVAHAYLHLGDLALHEDAPGDGRALAERGMAEGEALGDGYSLRIGSPILARALMKLGEATAAGDAARRGLEAARAGGFVVDEGRNLVALGQTLWAGDIKAAATVFERAEAIFRQAGATYLLAETLWVRAVTALRARRHAAAAALGEALTLARAAGAQPLVTRIVEAQKELTAGASSRR